MIDAIFIAMTGLHGYETGLRVISNDTANLNTPGYKNSSLLFSDLFYSSGYLGGGGSEAYGQYGYGLETLGTVLSFDQGQLQSTGNNLDLAVDGLGLFMLRDDAGHIHYTRDGQFKFNSEGFLVSTTTGEQVMAVDASGNLAPITIANLKTDPATATSIVTFSGNLSSTATTDTVGNVTVIDKVGTSHTLQVKLDAVAGTPGSWNVALLDGTTTVGTGTIAFINGQPDPAKSKVSITYTPSGQSDVPLTLDFSSNVTSFDSGSRSTLAVASQDGFGAGDLVSTAFDASGTLQLTYSNGQVVKGSRLALGRFSSQDAISPVGDNEFEVTDAQAWQTGVAGEQGFGTVRSGMIEASNVDLSQEFSELVIMQRGYQASSQVISTANDMLTELFGMRGK
jgi:flagellar hook protein FlgE